MNLTDDRPLRFGLVLPDGPVDVHIHRLVAWAIGEPAIDLSDVFLAASDPARGVRSGPVRLLSPLHPPASASRFAQRSFELLRAAESVLLRRDVRHRDHLDARELPTDRTLRRTRVRNVAGDGHPCALSAEDVRTIASADLDLLLVCDLPGLAPQLAEASRLGVLAVHPSADLASPGAPIGFWEVHQRRARGGYVIVAFEGGDAAPRRLLSGLYRMPPYGLLAESTANRMAVAHLGSVLLKVAAAGSLTVRGPLAPLVPEAPLPTGVPSCAQSATSLLRLIAGRLAMRVSERFERTPSWRIAWTRTGWVGADLARARDVPNPPGRFLADPFVIERGGRTVCFVEDCAHGPNRGRISALDLSGDQPVWLGPCIDEPFHLSFPFLFEHDGALYMCPESSEARQVRVYRCMAFPMRWELAAVALDGVSAADTLMFEADGRWWMLTNIDSGEVGDHCSELHAFWSDSPLSGHWTPHRGNPLIVDPDRARNGGMVLDGERIVRGAQSQAFGVYGHALRLFEVTRLTEGDYEERCVREIRPSFRAGLDGIHHFATDGRTVVFDVLGHTRRPPATTRANAPCAASLSQR